MMYVPNHFYTGIQLRQILNAVHATRYLGMQFTNVCWGNTYNSPMPLSWGLFHHPAVDLASLTQQTKTALHRPNHHAFVGMPRRTPLHYLPTELVRQHHISHSNCVYMDIALPLPKLWIVCADRGCRMWLRRPTWLLHCVGMPTQTQLH